MADCFAIGECVCVYIYVKGNLYENRKKQQIWLSETNDRVMVYVSEWERNRQMTKKKVMCA